MLFKRKIVIVVVYLVGMAFLLGIFGVGTIFSAEKIRVGVFFPAFKVKCRH
jgi:hypothetical protein